MIRTTPASPARRAVVPAAAGALALALLAACGEPDGFVTCAPPVGDSPVRGPADAWVTVVELADFACPYCAAAQPALAQVISRYGDDVRLVFKHLPLPMHERARPAAIAAECAHAQGRFWPLYDRLFTERDLSDAGLEAAAAAAGVDLEAWRACRASTDAAGRVAADEQLARAAGVTGTPTFFINGEMVVGAQPEEELRRVIDARLEEARASGVDRAVYYEQAVRPVCAGGA